MSWWTHYTDIPFWMCNETTCTLILVWFLVNLVLSRMTFWDLSRNRWREMIKEDKTSGNLQSSAVVLFPFHLHPYAFCSLICLFHLYLGINLGLDTDTLRLWTDKVDTVHITMKVLRSSPDKLSPDPNHVAVEQHRHSKQRSRLASLWKWHAMSKSLTWKQVQHGWHH